MSRIIVKNLPKAVTAKYLENLFAEKGIITDLQLKYTKDGKFRQFAFVGYKTEEEAQAAKEYFNNTFVYTSKISVDTCTNLTDPNKPKSWRQRKAEYQELKQKQKDFAKAKEQEAKSPKKKKASAIPEELLSDAKFKEFLEVNKDRKSKPVWAEDVPEISESNSKPEEDSSSDSDYDANYKEEELKQGPVSPTKDTGVKGEKQEQSTPQKRKKKKKTKLLDDSYTVIIRNLPLNCKIKYIKQFFPKLKIVSLRFPRKKTGFAYVQFKSEKDMKKALIKNKGFLVGRRVEVAKFVKKATEKEDVKGGHKEENSKEKNEELLAETGRIFVRNLCYTVTENDVEQLFSKYGPLTEVHIPIDYFTKLAQGFAFVTFMLAEHAVKAFTELDGTIFQGRVLHLIPAETKKEYEIDENETNYQKKKEAKLKQQSGSSHNWNILFLGKNAVCDVIAQKYNVEKSILLEGTSRESVAVRLALAETETVLESRNFLLANGVRLDAFSQPDGERSKTVIVVKHLPAGTQAEELTALFARHGSVARLVMPPSGLIALVEFDSPAEAKVAFRRLAYTRFHNLPLYLEWAPVDGLKEPPPEAASESLEKSKKEEEKPKDEEKIEQTPPAENDAVVPEEGTTIFVRNINFNTTEDNLKKHFERWGSVHNATISTKMDIKTGRKLSMGFGFVQFQDRDSAVKALQNLQHSKLDDYSLELKFANRDTKAHTSNARKKYEIQKQSSSKIIVRNIPFHASQQEVKELFKQFGTLKSVRLPKKLDGSSEHKGFGFVEYITKDSAERAFNALCHSTHLFGRRLVLEWAKSDENDVEELRKRTAKGFVNTEPKKKKMTKRTLNDDVALAAVRFGDDT